MAIDSTPAIAAIGIIGQQDEPLHIALFHPHEDDLVDISYLLNSSLDIFDIRLRQKSVDQDLGLLHAIDERMSTYGWLTNTGMKFVIAIDMMGRPAAEQEPQSGTKPLPRITGLRDADLKPAFRAVHAAYVELLMNPFHTPEDRTPLQVMNQTGRGAEITSRRFKTEILRIGKTWYPGIISI